MWVPWLIFFTLLALFAGAVIIIYKLEEND